MLHFDGAYSLFPDKGYVRVKFLKDCMLFLQDRFPEAEYLNKQCEHSNPDSWTQFQDY